jgi:hypothetical protein
MKENKMHMVPQVVVDCAENIFNPANNAHMRDAYVMRIEAIRDYCNEMLQKSSNIRTLNIPTKRKHSVR